MPESWSSANDVSVLSWASYVAAWCCSCHSPTSCLLMLLLQKLLERRGWHTDSGHIEHHMNNTNILTTSMFAIQKTERNIHKSIKSYTDKCITITCPLINHANSKLYNRVQCYGKPCQPRSPKQHKRPQYIYTYPSQHQALPSQPNDRTTQAWRCWSQNNCFPNLSLMFQKTTIECVGLEVPDMTWTTQRLTWGVVALTV